MMSGTLSVPTASARPSTAMRRRRTTVVLVALAVITLVISVYSLSVGGVRLDAYRVASGLLGTGSPLDVQVVRSFQLPRITLALIVGGALAVSGALMQSVVRNPLASPDVLGITKGAGAFALLALLLLPGMAIGLVPVVALVGGVLAALIIYLLAYKNGTTPLRLAFVGVAIGAGFEALIRYLLMRYPQDVNASLTWLSGSLYGRTWTDVIMVVPWVLAGLIATALVAHRVEVMALGDPFAVGLGEHAERVRILAIAIAVVLASAAVAGAGTVAFVGLISPHVARRFVGGRLAHLLPTAALFGALLLVTADTLGRGLMPPLEIPAGLVTAVIGAPFFIYMLLRRRK